MVDVPSRDEFNALTANVSANAAAITALQKSSFTTGSASPSPAPAATGFKDSTDITKWKLAFGSDWTKPLEPTWQHDFYFGDRVLNGNGEREYYLNDGYTGDGGYKNADGTNNLGINPFSVNADGSLRISAAVSDPAKSAHYWGYPYTSGLITTEPSFSTTYGRFVASMKLPLGKGLWPAFWLLPVDKSWPPEIDVMEAFTGKNANNEGGPTMTHWGTQGAGSQGAWVDTKVDLTQDFHEYACEWDAQHVTMFFDGKQIGQQVTPASYNKPMYMLANLAVGGTWPGLPDATTKFPAFLDIGYIRAYATK